MPYIKQKDRNDLIVRAIRFAQTPGELNYQITTLLNEYRFPEKLSYQKINDILGALEGAKLEFYRRVAAPYENDKIEQNGDVY